MILPLQLTEAAGPVAAVERLGGHRGHDSDALAFDGVRTTTVVVVVLAALAACAVESEPVTEADYLADLQEICADTTDTISALPQPPEEIPVAAFATSAASALDNEAERARTLEVPDDLADDHRAFVRNADEQAAAWRAIANAADDELDELTVRVGELIRGRNDLVAEMGAPGCRRGEV